MTWEETIEYIRKNPDFKDLVVNAYFDEKLYLNVERFSESEEYKETLALLKKHAPNAKTLLDIGSGNGISAVNFAKSNYKVTSVEPDKSNTIGAGAIKILKEHYNLENLEVFEDFAEDIAFPENSFDVVYVRQALHHANDLNKFLKESLRVLKPGGLLLTIRDHVVFDENDKKWFLEKHPLHKFYGGENAFSPTEYRNAIIKAGGEVISELKYFDSVINYFPTTVNEIASFKTSNIKKQKKRLKDKIKFFGGFNITWLLYKSLFKFNALDEKRIPGRMYSYIVLKK